MKALGQYIQIESQSCNMSKIIIKVSGKVVYEGESGDVEVKDVNINRQINNISVNVSGKTVINGVSIGGSTDIKVEIAGDVTGSVIASGSVNCNLVGASVHAGGSVTCGDVGRDVEASGSATCQDVKGNVDAGGSVKCGNIGGSVNRR
jgi:hypothetical protein